MGQSSSCIQGVPDWVGPYEKSGKHASASEEEKMLYDRLRELILLSSITKDYSALEDFLSSNADICSSLKIGSLRSNDREKEFHSYKASKPLQSQDVKEILTSSLHKESHCKSVNFSTDPKDSKPTNVKPVIIRKDCAVHGSEPKCKVHSQPQGSPQSSYTSNHSNTASSSHSPQRKGVLVKSPGCRAHGSVAKSVRFPSGVGPQSRPVSPPSYGATTHATPPQQICGNTKQAAASEKLVCKATTHLLVSENIQKKEETVSNTERNSIPLESGPLNYAAHVRRKIFGNDDDSCSLSDSDDDDVESRQWLKDLLSSSQQHIKPSDLLAAVGVQSAKDTINRLEDRAETIVETFGVVLKHLEHGDWSTFCMSTSRLCDDIRKVLRDYNVSSEATDAKQIKIRNHVIEALHQLTSHTLSLKEMSEEVQHQVLLPAFRVLGEVLHGLMEFLISKELKVIVESIHNESSGHCVKMALCALAEMATSGELMVELITQVGGIKSLLNFCQNGKWKQLQPLAIRTLTIMCVHAKAAIQLHMIGGLDFIISSLLSTETEESVQCEVVGLLAQVMKCCSENSLTIQENVRGHMPQLVQALTDLAKKALSSETFLLCAASLATLSSCSTEASSWVKQHEHEMRSLSTNSKLESYV